MRETNKPTVLAAVDCHTHGVYDDKTGRYDVPWCGTVECHTCKRIFVCVETLTNRTYPSAPDDGYCPCGSWLLPRTKEELMAGQGAPVFSGRPLCDACGKLRTAPAEKIEKAPARTTFEIKYTVIARYALVAAAVVGLMIASRYC